MGLNNGLTVFTWALLILPCKLILPPQTWHRLKQDDKFEDATSSDLET